MVPPNICGVKMNLTKNYSNNMLIVDNDLDISLKQSNAVLVSKGFNCVLQKAPKHPIALRSESWRFQAKEVDKNN